MRILVFTILILFHLKNLHAQEVFCLKNNFQDEFLPESSIKIFVDSSRQLNYTSILAIHEKKAWLKPKEVNFKKYNYWLQVSICNHTSDSKWLIELLNFDIDQVLFYDITRDSFIETGATKKFSTRSIQHKNFAFDLAINPGETKTYLIKVYSKESFHPILKIRTYPYFISYATKEYIMLGIYYGLFLFIICYNFFIFLSIKDISYIYYLVYILAIGLNSLQWDGLGFQYIWPDIPSINLLLTYSSPILLISFCAYAIHFLELRKKNRVFYFLTFIFVTLYLLLFIINKYFPISYFHFYYLIPYLFLCGVSMNIYIRGEHSIRFFVLGNIIIVLSQFAHYLVLNGIHVEK